MIEYSKLPFDDVGIQHTELKTKRSIELTQALERCNSATFIECRKENDGDKEIIIFDLEIPLGQNPPHDIRYIERIAVEFSSDNNIAPWVYALRADFPKLPHLLLGVSEFPRSLCIYEESYQESLLKWRPEKFIDDITTWLYRNAYGILHKKDQPLEPLLTFTEGLIVIPPDLKNGEDLFIYKRPNLNGRLNLIASRNLIQHEDVAAFHSFLVVGKPQEHGGLNEYPVTLFGVLNFLENSIPDIKEMLLEELEANKDNQSKRQSMLLIVAYLPKTAIGESSVTGLDQYVFFIDASLQQIGVKIGLWQEFEGNLADIFQPNLDWEQTKRIVSGVLSPTPDRLKSKAADFNNISSEEQKMKIALIGVGALGSQLFMNLSKMGFGKWTLIDHDILLPHNLSKHALSGGIGFSKSKLLSSVSNQLLDSQDHSEAIWDNFLTPENSKGIETDLKTSDVILDISTSIAVEREVIDDKYGSCRRFSLFLNPKGTDLVILAEDKDRNLRLDVLEFQFYRSLLYNLSFQDHLTNEGDTIRYSNSCRSITNRIPQDHIATLSSIASINVRKLVKKTSASINLWKLIGDGIEVTNYPIDTYSAQKILIKDWEVWIDEFLIDKMTTARFSKLPNETGGILIGGYDMHRRKIYLVDSILSPADSYEYPTAYIRGIDGVENSLNFITQITNDNLKYIGEWHSHPTGVSLQPSSDDIKLFAWLQEEMQKAGFPAVMIIVGADGSFNLMVQG